MAREVVHGQEWLSARRLQTPTKNQSRRVEDRWEGANGDRNGGEDSNGCEESL